MWIDLLATWFYSGHLPKSPGTWGTLATVPLAFGLFFLSPVFYLIFSFSFVLVAIYICSVYEANHGTHDDKRVVIDEVAGFLVALTWLPFTWQSFVAAFVLFRLFDIWKPGPIGILDKKAKGGFGVVIDDVAAGMVTNVILQTVYIYTPYLGSQL